jgi:hypothetical protein
MSSLTAKRTLVKSPPELWSELSEIDRLAKHLEAFGEIKITKLEPEHTVAWEGESASGTVSIEPSGWGTKVTMTAQVETERVVEEPEPVIEEPEPVVEEPEPIVVEAEPQAAPLPRRGFLGRFFGRRHSATDAPRPEPPAPEEPAPEPPAPEPPAPEPPGGESDRAQAALEDALEALGSAHHRPFSRG